jgi:hypothetical protein
LEISADWFAALAAGLSTLGDWVYRVWDHEIVRPFLLLFVHPVPYCHQGLTIGVTMVVSSVIIAMRAAIGEWTLLWRMSEASIDISGACLGIAASAPIAAYCLQVKVAAVLQEQSEAWLFVPIGLSVLLLTLSHLTMRDMHRKSRNAGGSALVFGPTDWLLPIGALGVGVLILSLAATLAARFIEHGACQ